MTIEIKSSTAGLHGAGWCCRSEGWVLRAGAPPRSSGSSIRAQTSGASPAHRPGTSGHPWDPPLSPCILCPPSPENTQVSNVTGATGACGFMCGEGALASAERTQHFQAAGTLDSPFFVLAFCFHPLQCFSSPGAFLLFCHPSLSPPVWGCKSSRGFRCHGSDLMGRQEDSCDGRKG